MSIKSQRESGWAGLTDDAAVNPPSNNETPEMTIYQWRYIQQVIGHIASEDACDQMAQSIRDELFQTIGVPR